MRKRLAAACLLAVSVSGQAFAQATMMVPYGGDKPVAVPKPPPADPRDTPEEIAKDSARDLKYDRFYNRPGATRAQYDADWQDCRLIARGSRTPSGMVPMYYNPAVMSPVAAGIAGGLGGLLAGAIAEGQQRRANRRTCLLVRGWRLVEVPATQKARVAAMTDQQRDAYFNAMLGAAAVEGDITERKTFALARDIGLDLDAPLAGPGTLYFGKKVDPRAPFALGPDEAAVVVAYRRPGPSTAGRAGVIQLARYDLAGRDLVYRPKDWKKKGDKTVYSLDAASKDGKAAYEVQLLRVTPGDYVIASTAVGTKMVTSTNCFGAPVFHVGAGEVAYLGDFIPYWNARLASGMKTSVLAHAPHVEDARRTLAGAQPTLAAAMKPAAYRNRATYACSAIAMDRWDLPDVEPLPDAAPAPAATKVAAAP